MKILIEKGYVNPSKMTDIAITSKNKSSRGKRYYAKDVLAFEAWYLQNLSPDDKDFQRWKKETKRR